MLVCISCSFSNQRNAMVDIIFPMPSVSASIAPLEMTRAILTNFVISDKRLKAQSCPRLWLRISKKKRISIFVMSNSSTQVKRILFFVLDTIYLKRFSSNKKIKVYLSKDCFKKSVKVCFSFYFLTWEIIFLNHIILFRKKVVPCF